MKISRKKQIKRIIKYYRINYGFEEPYRLLSKLNVAWGRARR